MANGVPLEGENRGGQSTTLRQERKSSWSDRAKSNSYLPDKTQLRHDIGTEGCKADLKAD